MHRFRSDALLASVVTSAATVSKTQTGGLFRDRLLLDEILSGPGLPEALDHAGEHALLRFRHRLAVLFLGGFQLV